MRRAPMIRTVTKKMVDSMKLRGKLPCPYCHKTLIFVHEDMRGHTTQKCVRCKQEAYVDLDKMETAQIVDDVVAVS